MEDFGFFGDETFTDPYDSMPFGDAMRFEENQLAGERDDDFLPEFDDEDDEEEEEFYEDESPYFN